MLNISVFSTIHYFNQDLKHGVGVVQDTRENKMIHLCKEQSSDLV